MASATAATTWDGSVALAMFLARAPELVLGKRVVELGSGTAALPGLAAALLGAMTGKPELGKLEAAEPLLRALFRDARDGTTPLATPRSSWWRRRARSVGGGK